MELRYPLHKELENLLGSIYTQESYYSPLTFDRVSFMCVFAVTGKKP